MGKCPGDRSGCPHFFYGKSWVFNILVIELGDKSEKGGFGGGEKRK